MIKEYSYDLLFSGSGVECEIVKRKGIKNTFKGEDIFYDQHIESKMFGYPFFSSRSNENLEKTLVKAESWAKERCEILNKTIKKELDIE